MIAPFILSNHGLVSYRIYDDASLIDIGIGCVRATLNCYLWTCTKAVPKIQVKASWAHT